MCWFGDRPLRAGDRLRLKHTTRVTPAVVEAVVGRLRRERRSSSSRADELRDNDIGVVDAARRPPRWPSTPTGGPDHRQLRADRRGSPTPPWPPGMVGPPRPAMADTRPAPYYPVSSTSTGGPCLVVGGGPVAARKAAGLVGVRRRSVTVVAPTVEPGDARPWPRRCAVVETPPVPIGRRGRGYRLVVTATGDRRGRRGGVRRRRGRRGLGQQRRRRRPLLVHPAVGAPRRHGHRRGVDRGRQPGAGGLAALRLAGEPSVAGVGTLAALLGEARRRLDPRAGPPTSVDWRACSTGRCPALVRAGAARRGAGALARGRRRLRLDRAARISRLRDHDDRGDDEQDGGARRRNAPARPVALKSRPIGARCTESPSGAGARSATPPPRSRSRRREEPDARHDPSVPDVRAVTDGDQDNTEDRDPVHDPSGPVDPGRSSAAPFRATERPNAAAAGAGSRSPRPSRS